MKKIIKSKKGEGYIDVVIGIFAMMMVLVVVLNIFQFMTLKQDLDEIAVSLLKQQPLTAALIVNLMKEWRACNISSLILMCVQMQKVISMQPMSVFSSETKWMFLFRCRPMCKVLVCSEYP